MASSSTQKPSSSSSAPTRKFNFGVFLSFRGEDTRYNFTDHLFVNLNRMGINTFRDNKLERGEEIAQELFGTIEESRFSIIVFSEKYADSKWCLDELTKIMECRKELDQKVLPVFYHVDPSDVRKQTGSFGEAFAKHETTVDEEKVQRWRAAMTQASSLSGWHVKHDEFETEHIEEICKYIITRLNRKPLDVGKHIVGLDFHLEQLKSRIKTESDEAHIVGICGIGGIGKTTIAMAIYNDILSQFDGSSFLKNVGGKDEDGLVKLQKQLFKDILNDERQNFSSSDAGITEIKEKFRLKRVLIVLDDVADNNELEKLVGDRDWYGVKSLIIITTRGKHLLKECEENAIYEVEKLNLEKSTELFSWWAFKQNASIPEFESLSNSIVKYVDGLPIALKVLGSMLFKKSIAVWESAWEKLKKIPHNDVQSVLKVSYDKLDNENKGLFLDIACFFRGEDKDAISSILGSYVESGIDALHDSCLITISGNKLDMHDLVQQMGREIVRQQCIGEPGKRSRLWDPKDVDDVLTRNTGTEAIEGLFVEIAASNRIQFSTNSFTKLNRLRLLKVYHHWSVFWNETEVYLPMDLEIPSLELRYLYFERYPLESLPTNFNAENLVELNLKHSSIKQPWKKNEILPNLKVINLSHSMDLVELPDLSSVQNLEILILIGCTSLVNLPKSFGNLSRLREIDLSQTGIKKLPSPNGHLEALKHLNLKYCKELVSLPSSIGHLKALKHLNLEYCTELVSLPSSIGHLKALKHLNLKGCSNLKSFPKIKDDMENLERLDLRKTKIKQLPSSIGHLKALKHLNLESCTELVSLPKSIWNLSSLETLEVTDCPKLERLEANLWGQSSNLTCLILKGGIWWSNDRFSSLKTLNLRHNKMEGEVLNNHVFPLVELYRRESIHLKKGIIRSCFDLSSLELSSFGNPNPMAKGILSDIFNQISWESLSIYHSSLVELSLSNCNLMDGEILNHVCHLSSLKRLNLEGSHFRRIPTGISQLTHLRGLNLSHCKRLTEIPELPSSLRFLDAHRSNTFLSSPSWLSIPSPFYPNFVVNCIKSELIQEQSISVGSSYFQGKGMSIVISKSSGIVKGIKIQRSNEVEIELPQNWYGNNDLLGFAVCCVYVPMLDDEFQSSFWINCKLAIRGYYPSEYKMDELSFRSWSRRNEYSDGYYPSEYNIYPSEYTMGELKHSNVSDQVWVIYYPKDAIEKEYRSNQWTHFMASFHGCNRLVEVKECGIHPIYYGCFKCQQNEECEWKVCLKGEAMEKLPIIVNRSVLGSLCLRECRRLFCLPRTICEFKSLIILSCSGFSDLEVFPEIQETMENLRELHLDGTGIEELPSSIQRLSGLRRLNLEYCNYLVSLPNTFCYLKSLVFLSCLGCSRLKRFPEILENMENLKELYLDGTAIKELPASIEHLGGLQVLRLSKCSNLASLPESICNLRLLKELNVNFCSKLDKFPENLGSLQCLEVLGVAGFDSNQVLGAIQNDVFYMSSWEASNLSINYFSSILAGIIQLSKLRDLNLSHCQNLLQIPELPPSLRALDVHACPCLDLSSPSSLLDSSLFRCFRSVIEEFECGSNRCPPVITIIMPGNNGIPEWISQQKKGSKITIKLPKDWYQNNDFLGFALYFVYVPSHIESKEDFSLKCELNFYLRRGLSRVRSPMGELSLKDRYSCCHNGGKSNRVWVAYYPKVAIKKKYVRRLKASFHGLSRVKVKECGFHLIYMPNTHVQSSFDTNLWPRLLRENTGFNVKRSRDDAEDHPTEDPHPKRSRHL